MKRVLWLIFVAFSTVAGALLFWYMRSVVVLLLAAIVLGATLRPAASLLSRIGLPRTLSALFMVLVVFVLVLGGIALLGFALGEGVPMLLQDLQLRAVELQSSWKEGAGWQQAIAANITAPMSLDEIIAAFDSTPPELSTTTGGVGGTTTTPAQSEREQAASAMLRIAFSSAGSVMGLIAQLVILIFVSLYWSLEHEWFERLWISLLPVRLRQPARTTWRALEVNVGMHIRSEILQSLIAGIVIYLGFRLLGVDQPLSLAITVALAWLIPLVGGVIALVVLIPIALLSPLWILIASSALLIGVLLFLEFFLEPRLDTARDRLEILGLIVAMVMLQLFGIVGLLLASPLAVVFSTIYNTWDFSNEDEDNETTHSATALVRRRLATLRLQIDARGETLPLRTRSLYERLETIVDAAESESGLELERLGSSAAVGTAREMQP